MKLYNISSLLKILLNYSFFIYIYIIYITSYLVILLYFLLHLLYFTIKFIKTLLLFSNHLK